MSLVGVLEIQTFFIILFALTFRCYTQGLYPGSVLLLTAAVICSTKGEQL